MIGPSDFNLYAESDCQLPTTVCEGHVCEHVCEQKEKWTAQISRSFGD